MARSCFIDIKLKHKSATNYYYKTDMLNISNCKQCEDMFLFPENLIMY